MEKKDLANKFCSLPRALALALAACAALCSAPVQAISGLPRLEDQGLDAKFIDDSLVEFKAMGFAMDVFVVDFDAPEMRARAASLSTKSAVFSIVSGFGSKAKCIVGMRSSAMLRAPERRLVGGVASLGGQRSQAWRIVFRHELGHCALQYAMLDPSEPDRFLSEPFADVFALDWTAKVDAAVGKLNAELYGDARRLVSGGAHATWPAIARWKQQPRASSPCQAAWKASPYDDRAPEKACPKF